MWIWNLFGERTTAEEVHTLSTLMFVHVKLPVAVILPMSINSWLCIWVHVCVCSTVCVCTVFSCVCVCVCVHWLSCKYSCKSGAVDDSHNYRLSCSAAESLGRRKGVHVHVHVQVCLSVNVSWGGYENPSEFPECVISSYNRDERWIQPQAKK